MKLKRCSYTKITVVFADKCRVLGLTLRKSGDAVAVTDFTEVPVEEDHTGAAFRAAAKKLGVSRERILIFFMPLPDAVFMSCRIGNLAPKYLRSTLVLELENRLIKQPADLLFQYAVPQRKNADEMIDCNIYAFPSSVRRKADAAIMQGVRSIDHFVYPLMGITSSSPAVYIPGLEADFYFSEGEWHPVSALPSDWFDAWKPILGQKFRTDSGFDLKKYLPCLLIADFVFSGKLGENISGVQVFPKNLYTGRYRRQLIVMGILLLVLAATVFFKFFSKVSVERNRYLALQGEIASLQRKNRNAQVTLKSSEKELRDQGRTVEIKAGEGDVLGKLAALSSVLPKNVMIVSFRLNENGIDLVMRSEAENLNLQNLLAPLNMWKVASVRQFRRGNESAGTVMAKLVPLEDGGTLK